MVEQQAVAVLAPAQSSTDSPVAQSSKDSPVSLGSLLSPLNYGHLFNFNTVEFTTSANPYEDLHTCQRAQTLMNSTTNAYRHPELKAMHTNMAHACPDARSNVN